MKKIFAMLLLLAATLTLSAQTQLASGYYHLKVVRSGGTVYSDNGLVWQNQDYSAPKTYTANDLKYIFKIEVYDEYGACTFMNCQSKEFIALPSSSPQTSVQLPTKPNPVMFYTERTQDNQYWAFYTMVTVTNSWGTYEGMAYLNDFASTYPRSICLWTDDPNDDIGSCFTVQAVDSKTVEALMNGGTVDPNPDPDPDPDPDPTALVSFNAEAGVTYTLFSRNTNGYMAGNGDVKSEVAESCEYAFENSGIDEDGLPTYYIKQVSSSNYLQKVDLSEADDTSDLQLGLPHGSKSNAARFTVVQAMSDSEDYRAMCADCADGEYVICCTDGYWHKASGEYLHYYVESFSRAMFYAPYNDGNIRALRIERYVPGSVTPPTTGGHYGDDQSVDLWGAASDTIAVQQDGYVLLIPDNMIESIDYITDGSGVAGIDLKGGTDSYSGYIVETPHIGADYPKFRTFKFNNKYNDILTADVEGTVGDNEITVDITGCIGKTLCPSFSLTDESANVYYRGVRQLSHKNRNRFDKPLTYTVARPGYKILQVVKTKDEVWSNPSSGVNDGDERISLSPDQLSTNAPSGRYQDVDKLVDDNLSTYYHSTWTNDPLYTPLTWDAYFPENTVWPYVDISLNEQLRKIKWGYVCGPTDRRPTGLKLLASKNGHNWTEVAEYDEDELAHSDYEEFYSEAIDLGSNYRYLRLQLTNAYHKNYLVMRELYLFKPSEESEVTPSEPELLEPAEYEFSERPWGRDVVVNATFATDRASNVPRIDINLDNGVSLSYIHYNKKTYYPGTFAIDGAGVFPDMEPTPVNMRGRGNSSWSASKKPYRLKFEAKQKPFGLKKGKSWCLIAQAQTGSMLTNPIALRVATMTGTMGANHAIPVELYVNGDYIGSYMFTENPGFGNNSIDIDETNACLLELDTYYDEAYKFQDYDYYLPVNIKEPDLTELTDYNEISATMDLIRDHFCDYTEAIASGNAAKYESMTDVDSWSRFMLVNDVVRNTELMWPKSVKLFRVDMTNEDDPYVWGPVWDFDWAFGYEGAHTYYINAVENDLYTNINQLGYDANYSKHGAVFHDMLNGSEALKADRYRVWTEFMDIYRDELLDYVDDYHNFAKPSFANNATRWSDGRDYTQNAANARNWLKARTDWVYKNMPKYDLPVVSYGMGDVDEDGRVSVGDVICVVNHMLELPNDYFNRDNADMNGDGKISIGDVQLIIRAILDAENSAASARAQMPRCAATLTVMPFTTEAHAEAEVQVNLSTEELTAGLQMDVVLPAGATLTNVRTANGLAAFGSRISDLGNNRYRVLLTAMDGSRIEAGDDHNMLLDITMGEIPASKKERTVRINNITLASPEGSDLAVSSARALFAEATGVSGITADEMMVHGGDDLSIQSVKEGDIEVFNLAGQLVKRVHVTRGTTVVNLPMGVYVVNGYKVMVD